VQNIKNSIWLFLLLSMVSCRYFQKDTGKRPIARIYDSYLYFEDIPPQVYRQKTPEDSTNAIHQYLEDWAYKTLLVKQAERNVDTVKINRLVKLYRQDLLTETYKELLLHKYLDTLVPNDTLQKYYESYQQYFKAGDPWILPKYLVMQKTNPKTNEYKKWFFSDKPELTDSLIKHQNAFEKFDISARKWYKLSEFKEEFPVLKRINDKYILKKPKKFVLTDSLSLYLVLVKDFVKPKENLPLEIIKNDLKQLILNKRKKTALSKLEQNVKQEAINKKIFKIYKTKQPNE